MEFEPNPSGPADELSATFDMGAGPFALTGFDNFTGLTAGAAHTLSVSFDPLVGGIFEQVGQINLFGENVSGFNGGVGSFNVTFKGTVLPSAVRVPAAVWMLGMGLFGLWGARRRVATNRQRIKPPTRETMNKTRKIKKIFAISVAPAAIPPKPKAAAIIAMTKKHHCVMQHLNSPESIEY